MHILEVYAQIFYTLGIYNPSQETTAWGMGWLGLLCMLLSSLQGLGLKSFLDIRSLPYHLELSYLV